jgi:hypothetical protein
MSKSDLKARPIFHHKKEAIEAHLTVVMAALAIGRTIESKIELSLKRLVRTLEPIRSGYDYPEQRGVSSRARYTRIYTIPIAKTRSGALISGTQVLFKLAYTRRNHTIQTHLLYAGTR